MSLWDDLPDDLKDSGALDGLEPILSAVETPTSTEETDDDGTWRVYNTSVGADNPLSLNPSTGRFDNGAGNGNTPIEFPDPRVTVQLRLHLDAPLGNPDGRVQLIAGTPKAIIRLKFLRGAKLDAQGQLREDPAHPDVKFHIPAIRIRVEVMPSGESAVRILSANTAASATDDIFEFVRMEPAYALIGPSDVVGFAFRTAVLDMSATAGPDNPLEDVFEPPADWQGFFLPEARMFVSPQGLEGLAVSAGVRNLWIGMAEHAGVTGIFEAEVVQRGSDPDIRLRFQTAQGEWIGVPATGTAPVELPESARLYIDATGGLAPYTYRVSVGSEVTTTDRVDVTTPASGNVSISIEVRDSGLHTSSRTLTVTRRTASATGSSIAGAKPAVLTNISDGFSRIVMVSQSATQVTLSVDPPSDSISWIWTTDGGAGDGSASGRTVTIPVAEGGSAVTVTASRTLLPQINCYFLFDEPPHRSNASQLEQFAQNKDNTRTEPASDRDGWSGGSHFIGDDTNSLNTDLINRLAEFPPDTLWTVDGFASYENRDDEATVQRNINLSRRRRDLLIYLLLNKANLPASSVIEGQANGSASAQTSSELPPGSGVWWRATANASLATGTLGDDNIIVQLRRPPADEPVADVDPEPQAPGKPDCFRKIGFRVELIRGTFVRAEVYGEFDIHTAAEQSLQANSTHTLPARSNPTDGIVQFLARLNIAEDRSNWDVKAEFRALSTDTDGLAKLNAPTSGNATGVNVVGAVAILAPVLATDIPLSPRDGDIIRLVGSAGAIALGATGVVATRHIILHGGELVITNGLVDPESADGPTSTQVNLMLDVETTFTADLGLVKVDPDKPLTARYKAVGFSSTWRTEPLPDGKLQYVPLPVFDPARGYTLDVPSGALVGIGGEDSVVSNLLRVVGTRISRDNPSYLEVEVAMGVDLGILTVDTARVRVRLDALEVPQLTKLGASLEIPGTLHGSGLVEITEGGFKGSFDLSITPLNIRASASLAVETIDGVTGVLVGIEVEFPVPIILGQSGLGIYGFLGGVGINYARKELTDVQAPALDWLERQLARPGGVMDPAGWEHQPGALAFAAGMLIGTVEGGFILHAKGIVLIEIPGPRLLLVMKADVLKLPPVLGNESSASFLAVLDIDFGRGTITIGIVAQYSIEKLLEIRVPVTAFFDTRDTSAWFVDLGTYDEPVTVNVLEVIEGTGYLMIHGNGISGLPAPLPATSGLSIATGFHISAVLMGSKSAGLYLEVAAGFDAIVSFDPFVLGGKIYARGELRLFIISIGASAELTVIVGRHTNSLDQEVDDTYVHGEVCGKVSFFFFDIEGCVSITIGEPPPAPPAPADLVAGVALVGRSPALVEGSAVYQTVDGKLADALSEDSTEPLPSVPLDAIPVVLFDVATDVAGGDVVLGGQARGSSGLPANPWIQRGENWWQYQVTSVTISGAMTDGETPATWWTSRLPSEDKHGPALALLSWVPTPTPRAVTYGEKLTTEIRERWGTVCQRVAGPAPTLWTFDNQPLGASRSGWTLSGIAWPDADERYRSTSAENELRVQELWRCGERGIDQLHGTDPAVVVGDAVRCPQGDDQGPVISLSRLLNGEDSEFSALSYSFDDKALEDVARLLATNVSLADAMAVRSANAWQPADSGITSWCEGRILRSPLGDSEKAAAGRAGDVDIVDAAWNRLGHRPPELGNAIRITQPGGLATLSVLLMVPVGQNPEHLVLQTRDVNGKVVNTQPLASSDEVNSRNPLPAFMTQSNRPWADPVLRALYLAARIGGDSKIWGLYYVNIKMSDITHAVDIGWNRQKVNLDVPEFYLIAANGLTRAEIARADWDESTVKRERELLETTLEQDPDNHALLQPGTNYTVRVGWKAASVAAVDQPPTTMPINWESLEEHVQEFRFTADAANMAPQDLTPWLLATTPAPDELGVFCRQPVRIALATQNVARLFEAYGEELRVQVRGASGKHPSPPGGSPGEHVVIPTVTGGLLQSLDTDVNVMTPWETAMHELVVELPCIPADIDRTHHEVLTIAYDLEPATDYLLDIFAVPLNSAASVKGRRIYRLGFSSGLFDSMDALALMVANAPLEHSYVANPLALNALSDRPSGNEVDTAIQAAGLPVPEVPRFPRVEILWNGDATPQPVAIVIESSETLWRERPTPTKVVDTLSAESPQPEWWAAINTAWMEPQVSNDVPAPGQPARAIVTRSVRAPGDTRLILILAPGSRGKQINVDLVMPENPLYQDVEQREPLFNAVLDRAPWEDM